MKCRLPVILAERKQNGLPYSQKWLREQVGLSASSISDIVSGKKDPTLQNAIRIAKVLGLNVEDIWYEE